AALWRHPRDRAGDGTDVVGPSVRHRARQRAIRHSLAPADHDRHAQQWRVRGDGRWPGVHRRSHRQPDPRHRHRKRRDRLAGRAAGRRTGQPDGLRGGRARVPGDHGRWPPLHGDPHRRLRHRLRAAAVGGRGGWPRTWPARLSRHNPAMTRPVGMLWTIGHSTREWRVFVDMLRGAGIEVLADVRRFAGSRRNPQFSPLAMAPALEAAGIDYVPMPEFGGRRKPRPDSPNGAWRVAAFRAYADYMAEPEYALARERLMQLASERRVAVMCAEAVWWRCHRRLI